MNVARRSIQSVTWNAIANGIILPIGFIQSVLLARLLPVEYFGIYGGIVAFLTIVGQLFDFGLEQAFLHRAEETENQDQAISVLFSFRSILSATRTLILLFISIFFFSDMRQMVLITLTITGFFNFL